MLSLRAVEYQSSSSTDSRILAASSRRSRTSKDSEAEGEVWKGWFRAWRLRWLDVKVSDGGCGRAKDEDGCEGVVGELGSGFGGFRTVEKKGLGWGGIFEVVI